MATVKGTAGASAAKTPEEVKQGQTAEDLKTPPEEQKARSEERPSIEDKAVVDGIHAAIQKAKGTAQGAAHGALFRLEMALADLKHCARTVEEHLGEDFRDLLKKIESL